MYSGNIMYPPRPKLSIPPEKLPDYENNGYVAQLKFNGTRTLVEIGPGSDIKLWTRKREAHKAYTLSDELKSELTSIHEAGDVTKTLIFDAELMHNKTKGLKDTLIIFDLLVVDSDYLVGMSMLERYDVLCNILGEPNTWEPETGRNIAIEVFKHVWLAQTFVFGFEREFKSRIDMDEIEGLVLKQSWAKLERGLSETNNDNWLVRCRKPNKNYSY